MYTLYIYILLYYTILYYVCVGDWSIPALASRPFSASQCSHPTAPKRRDAVEARHGDHCGGGKNLPFLPCFVRFSYGFHMVFIWSKVGVFWLYCWFNDGFLVIHHEMAVSTNGDTPK